MRRRYSVRASESIADSSERRVSRYLTGGQARSHLPGKRGNSVATDQLDARQARLGKNQALFRAVNGEIENIAQNHSADLPLDFLCECANPACDAYIELTRGEYEAVRENPTHFFVLPGHVFPEVESIAAYRGGYVVVEKFGAGGRVAEATHEHS